MRISGEVLGARTHVDLHSPVKSIVKEEVVCHADPVGFHRMALAIVVVPHITLGGKKRRKHAEHQGSNSIFTLFDDPVNVHPLARKTRN